MAKVLEWKQPMDYDNLWIADTEKYQYRMVIKWRGRTSLRILRQGDCPWEKPRLLKEYRDDKGAKTAARRWERKYGTGNAKGVDGLVLHLDLSIILNKKELADYCLAYGLDPENMDSVRSDLRDLLLDRIGLASINDEYHWTVKEN